MINFLRANGLDDTDLAWNRVITQDNSLAYFPFGQLVIILELVRIVVIILLAVHHLLIIRRHLLHHHWVAHHVHGRLPACELLRLWLELSRQVLNA